MKTMFEIKIIEGHDPSSYFWFRPVRVKTTRKILWEEVEELGEEFSIEEGDVDCFLSHFLYKHFDEELAYNKNRYEYGQGFVRKFEWYLTHNFYTYETLRSMLDDIAHTADLLEIDYDNPTLNDLKKRFSIYYMCPSDCEDYKSGDKQAIRRHIGVVTNFYRRFVSRLSLMMENNPETFLISIMGP